MTELPIFFFFVSSPQDLPSFTQSVQRLVNDLRYYRLCNSSLPTGTIKLQHSAGTTPRTDYEQGLPGADHWSQHSSDSASNHLFCVIGRNNTLRLVNYRRSRMLLIYFVFSFYCKRLARNYCYKFFFFFKRATPSLCLANDDLAQNVNLVCSWLLPRPGAV